MVQSAIDFFKVSQEKKSEEFEQWQYDVYNQTKLQFQNRSSGRITGEALPDTIDPKGKWNKYNLKLSERNHVSVNVTETEFILHDHVTYYVEISCSPAISINKGKNTKPASLNGVDKLISKIETDYCVKASDLVIHSTERSITITADKATIESFNKNKNRFIVFQNKPMHQVWNRDKNVFLGYEVNMAHYLYKFYLVDAKYSEDVNSFRIERRYNRMATFIRASGIKTLEDIRSIHKTLRCHQLTLKDIDDTIIYDPTIVINRKLSLKESRINENAFDPDFWINAKKNKDKDTFKNWLATYRNLSDELGDGLHTKIRNKVVEVINEVENEIKLIQNKNSPLVTSWITGNNRGIVDTVVSNNIDLKNNLFNMERNVKTPTQKRRKLIYNKNNQLRSILRSANNKKITHIVN